MISPRTKSARFGLALLGGGTLLALAPAGAQPAAVPASQESSSDILSRNLRSLAQNPRSLSALMGAGRAALDLGDAQAAVTFFARAEEIAPADGRIKMWIGSALVQLEQPRAAIKFFKDATDLGVPDADVARDRGLAYDISGDPRRAQRDYALVLQRGRDPEVTRRLALSLAISGERERALQLLEEQLLVRDRAAERTRTLVLALTGDSAGATRAVEASMPGPSGEAMASFLARLPALRPADRALAVHFGHFPGEGRTPAPSPQTYAALDPALRAGAPDSRQTALGGADPSTSSLSTQRRIPARDDVPPAATRPVREVATGTAIRQNLPARSTSQATTTASRAVTQSYPPLRSSLRPDIEPQPRVADRKPTPGAVESPSSAEPRPAPTPPPIRQPETAIASAASTQEPPVQIPETRPVQGPLLGVARDVPAQSNPSEPPQVEVQAATPPPPAETPAPPVASPAGSTRIADLAAVLAAIPEDTRPAPPRREAKRTPASAATNTRATAKEESSAAGKKPTPTKKSTPPAEPSRIWVQLASGAEKSALPRELARVKAKAAKLLAPRTAWTAAAKGMTRLVVGPFKTGKEAQDFVNALGKADVRAFAWTSEAGQKVERLPAK